MGKLTKRLSALTKDAFIKTVKKIRNSLIFSLQKQWYDTIYKRLSVQYTSSGTRNSVGGISYPFMRTRTLRESLALLKPKGRFTFTKDSYQYNFKIIGQLGPTGTPSFKLDPGLTIYFVPFLGIGQLLGTFCLFKWLI